LLGVVHTRIGFLYKFNRFFAKDVRLIDYGVMSGLESQNPDRVQNAKVAVSFASYRETIFISLSVLNLQLNGKQNEFTAVSPAYYVVNVGDLGRIFWWEDTNILFSAYMRQNPNDKEFAYFLHFKQRGLALNRESQFFFNLNVGYNSYGYLLMKPSLSYVNFNRVKLRRARRNAVEKNVINILYDFSVPLKTKEKIYDPTWQFSLTHFF
jgi:hypothetical protein